jgi:hypothetical protein
LAAKLSVAWHMGQTRGPAFLLFRWVASLAYLSVSSMTSPSTNNLLCILTDLPLPVNTTPLYEGHEDCLEGFRHRS